MNLIGAYVAGGSLYIGLVLILAGALKLLDLRSFEINLSHLLPYWMWRRLPLSSAHLALTAVLFELSLGTASLLCSGLVALPVAFIVSAVSIMFLVANITALAKGLPCGCFGKRKSPIDALDLARSVLFTILAVGAMLARTHVTTGIYDLTKASPGPVASVTAVLLMVSLLLVMPRRLRASAPHR